MWNIETAKNEEVQENNIESWVEEEEKNEVLENATEANEDFETRFEECFASFESGQLEKMMPEMPDENEEWYNEFADRIDDAEEKHRLGNLQDDRDLFAKLNKDEELSGFGKNLNIA